MMKNIKSSKNIIDDSSGQTFLEFMLLLFMILFMSYGLLISVNSAIGKRWENIVKIVAEPTGSTIQLRD